MNTERTDPGDARTVALDYYDGPEIVDTLLDALIHAGLDPDALDIDDLAPLDEFHALGRAATLALAELTAPQPTTGCSMSAPGLAVRPASWLPSTAHASRPWTRPLASAEPQNC